MLLHRTQNKYCLQSIKTPTFDTNEGGRLLEGKLQRKRNDVYYLQELTMFTFCIYCSFLGSCKKYLSASTIKCTPSQI